MSKIKVATSQFPISKDVKLNTRTIINQMQEARSKGADVIHFAECALSGYPGSEFESFKGYDWDLLKGCTLKVMEAARKLHMYVILGSSHPLSRGHKPHNTLYIINDRGRIVGRYDKRFCTTGDLIHYSPGDHFNTFTIKGVRCGALICHDYRYPELYREYKKRKVDLMFHSSHNGAKSRQSLKKTAKKYGVYDIWNVIVPPTIRVNAANNHMWISATNTSARESSWASFLVRPDGVVVNSLKRNRTGVVVTQVDTKKKLYDATRGGRDRALRGILNSGTLVKDLRSRNQTNL
jgi:deaminated glutathione amidase